MKYLLYFVIGGDPSYVKLLELCIKSIRENKENDIFDILVMCDKNYKNVATYLHVQHFYITETNPNIKCILRRKLEVFNFEKIHEYEKVLHLDCDIIISGSLAEIMNNVTNKNTLYVCNEKLGDMYNANDNSAVYFSRQDRPYTIQDIVFFTDNNIYPFNGGEFAFYASKEMKTHFNNVLSEIDKTNGYQYDFYDQRYMNDYFNRDNLINNVLTKYTYLCRVGGYITDKNIINHFINMFADYNLKYHYMQEFHRYYSLQPKHIDTREEFHKVLDLPKNPVIAEIGVFRGEYAQYLLQNFIPSRLYLVDPWENISICSGDQNGNNVIFYNGKDMYEYVSSKYISNSNIIIIRKTSGNIMDADIEPMTLDMIYIDGDHSYEGVKNDLMLALKLVKKGGWICGHDYSMNYAKTNNHYDFGVKKAVDEFCYENGYHIAYLANDGCVSYAIKNNSS
jgi:lipopolysaccharide biosynthesis glycosyltransferase